MERHLSTPIEEEVRELRVGDMVYLSGTVVTMRDMAHRRLIKLLKEGGRPPIELAGLAIFHAGPIVTRSAKGWKIVAIGPTTSWRMEKYEHEVIARTGVRLIVGKGRMGELTKKACRKWGAVYTIFPGGTAALATKCVRRVKRVYWLDLGMCEAMWVIEVENFGPLMVVIDSHGNSFYEQLSREQKRRLLELEVEAERLTW